MQSQQRRRGIRGGMLAGLSLLVLGASSLAMAQPPGGPPPGGGPGGPGGFGPPGGTGGRPGMFGPRISVANVPLAALDAELKLSAQQKQDIKQIQDSFRKEQRALMPGFPGGPGRGPGGPPNGGPPGGSPPNGGPPNGTPPDFEQMRANMEKIRSLDEKASKQIEALLTESQKMALPDALKELGDLGPTGIPFDILGDLKLTQDQKTRLIAVSKKSQEDMRKKMDEARQSGDFQSIRDLFQTSRETTHKQIMAVLTADQRTMVENFIKEHPMRSPGGFPGGPGGFGGFPGGPPRPGRGPGPGDGPPPPG